MLEITKENVFVEVFVQILFQLLGIQNSKKAEKELEKKTPFQKSLITLSSCRAPDRKRGNG